MVKNVRVCREDELPLGTQKTFSFAARRGILVHTTCGVRGFINACTHMGGSLELHKDKLVCCVHEAEFDPCDGKALCGQAPEGSFLTKLDISLVNGEWWAEIVLHEDPF